MPFESGKRDVLNREVQRLVGGDADCMGQRAADCAAMADDDDILAIVLKRESFHRRADAHDQFGEAFAAGWSLLSAQRPESVRRQREPGREVGVRQTLPAAEMLLDQIGFDGERLLWIAGREQRLGGRRVRDKGVTIQRAGCGRRAARARYSGAWVTRLSGQSGTSMVPYSIARAFSSTKAWRMSQKRVMQMSFAHQTRWVAHQASWSAACGGL